MSDFNSSLPVRTESAGDIIAKLADATTPSQQLAISAAGAAKVEGAGIAGTAAGGVLTVQGDPSGTPIPVSGSITATNPSVGATGASVPADATFVGFQDASGKLAGVVLTSAGALPVDGSAVTQPISATALPLPTGAATETTLSSILTNLGSPFQAGGSIGNTSFAATQATAANLNATVVGTGTFAVQAAQSGTWNIGSITTLPSLPSGSNTIGAVTQASGPWTENLTQIAGAVPSASNALPAQLTDGTNFISASNPLPVSIQPATAGTPVCAYKDASAIAAGSSDNHDYTVTALKTLHLQQVEFSGSGKAKMQLQIETGVASGVFNTIAVQFNSTATPNGSLRLASEQQVAAGVRVRVIMTNKDLLPQDLYSSIIGFEV